MNCSKCNKKAVFLNPNLCKKHFLSYFEGKVQNTIKKYSLVNKKDKIVVACSGGKDSTTVLYLLKKFHGQVVALAIDEGIVGYRAKTLVDLKKFCKENHIELRIYSFKKEFRNTLDEMLKSKTRPCSVCGTFRRYLLNKYAKNFDKIATGHNMDDESQVVLMNLFKGTAELLWNSVPKTVKVEKFVQKIKPLYFCSEKEVATYTFLKGFDVGFTECPYIDVSFRNEVRNALNGYSLSHKNVRQNILKKHLEVLENMNVEKKDYKLCKLCCEPSKGEICKACDIVKTFK